MAKSKKGGRSKAGSLTMGRKSKRGPAGEVHTGDGGVKKTVAGRGVKAKKGSTNAAARTPGAVRGA